MQKDFCKELAASGLVAGDILEKYAGQDNQSSLVYTILREELIEEKAFLDFYATFLNVPQVALKSFKFPEKLIDSIDPEILRKYYAGKT